MADEVQQSFLWPADQLPGLRPAAPPVTRLIQGHLPLMEPEPRGRDRSNTEARLADQFPEAIRVRGVLTRHWFSVAFAESCTAGLAAAATTSVASSAYVRGGVVTYTNENKIALGVRPETLATHHSVSPETAAEMAVATMLKPDHNTNIGIGITGLAGPNGDGTPRRVGEIYVGIAFRDTLDQTTWDIKVVKLERTDHLDREALRTRAVVMALTLITEVRAPEFGQEGVVDDPPRVIPHSVSRCDVRQGSAVRFARREAGELRARSAPEIG